MELELAGKVWLIPAVPAVDWLAILMDQDVDLERIILDLCPNGVDLLFDQTLEPEILYEGMLDLIEQVSGRYWWIALRLIGVVRSNWNVLGPEMFFQGIDPNYLSLSGWLDAMLVITMRAMDPKDVTMFVSQLEMPPKGEELEEEDMEMSAAQFLSMA